MSGHCAGGLKARALALEPEHAVAEHVGRGQPLAKAVRHGAKVFADDRDARPRAFQGQLRHQVIHRRRDIRALAAARAVRHPEQPRQAHRVVDAQRPGMAHIGGEQLAEGRAARARLDERIGRRQGPDLAFAREQIRRSADGHAAREIAARRPDLRAIGRRADGKIAVEPQRQARLAPRAAACPICRSHSHCRKAWKRTRSGRTLACTAGESASCRSAGQACHGPGCSSSIAWNWQKRVRACAALGDEAVERRDIRVPGDALARRLEAREGLLQRGPLDGPYAGVVDGAKLRQRARSQRRCCAKHAVGRVAQQRDVEIDRDRETGGRRDGRGSRARDRRQRARGAG